jgi:tRNA-dihydrouridine synthase
LLFYLAPLEGITGYIVRGAFAHHFPYIDKYFTPFIPAAKRMNKKILRDLAPQNNEGVVLVPQLIGNRADEILMMAQQLEALGFDEVNLNFGCPSGTVVAKKRGAGFLSCPEELDRLLDEVLTKSPIRVSVKTRIGMDSPAEWERLCAIYAKYPLAELIIHPRIQKDFYKNTPRLEAFSEAVEQIHAPLCYNGDINTVEDFYRITQQFPTVDRIMIGRGLLANPGLIGEIKGKPAAERRQIRAFHDEILAGCLAIFPGERDVVFHMKEIWFYLTNRFPERDKRLKQIQKCQTMAEYRLIVQQIFG